MGSFTQPKTTSYGAVRIADIQIYFVPNIRITQQSRYYALTELIRRAGIPLDFFQTWKVSVTPQKTTFEISNGSSKYISFPHTNPKVLKTLAAGELNYATLSPLNGAEVSNLSDCIVPFVGSEIGERRPLFYLADENHLECAVDLPL